MTIQTPLLLFLVLLLVKVEADTATATATATAIASESTAFPTYRTAPFNFTTQYRQDVCERHNEFLLNGTVSLLDALNGMQLRPHFPMNVGPLSAVDPIDGSIPPNSKDIAVRMFDELSVRAGFTWRDSYGASGLNDIEDFEQAKNSTPDGSGNIDFNNMLYWSIDTFDLTAGEFTKTLERSSAGVSFVEGHIDSSMIMVGLKPSSSSSSSSTSSPKIDLFGFLRPFDWQVWLLTVTTMIIAGAVYQWMEFINSNSDRQELQNKPTETMYFAALSFNGDIKFQPSTNYARLFVLTLSFWGLILSSAYTANLASFLVVQNTPTSTIETLADAVATDNFPICVLQGSAYEDAVRDTYPQALVVPVNNTEPNDVYRRVTDGTCAIALTSIWQWDIARRDRTINDECQLEWIGRVFRFAKSGFATLSDSGLLCSNLIRDVLSAHITAMIDDGTVQKITTDYLESIETVNCDSGHAIYTDDSESDTTSDTEDDDSDSLQPLGLDDLGGLFIIIYSVGAICCLAAFGSWLVQKYRPGGLKKEEQNKESSHQCSKSVAEFDTNAQNGLTDLQLQTEVDGEIQVKNGGDYNFHTKNNSDGNHVPNKVGQNDAQVNDKLNSILSELSTLQKLLQQQKKDV